MPKETKRNYIIGDNWIYYKIYTGPKISDDVLKLIVKPVVEELLIKKKIDKWFFIRFADPEHHIRLRFHCKKSANILSVIKYLYAHLVEFLNQDLIWKVQIDTYKRELERYGPNTIEFSEEIFYYDSKMVLDFIDLINGQEGEELRWLFSLKAIDTYLDSFGYTIEDKITLLCKLKTDFGNEFGISRSLKKQLDDKYRSERKKIDELMLSTVIEKTNYSKILKLLERKKKNIEKPVKKILKLEKSNKLQVKLDYYMASLIHMLMNRLFKSQNRLHEMVCYDFIYRHYKSIKART